MIPPTPRKTTFLYATLELCMEGAQKKSDLGFARQKRLSLREMLWSGTVRSNKGVPTKIH